MSNLRGLEARQAAGARQSAGKIVREAAAEPFLTVIVCTHDRPDYLATCLASLTRGGQPHPGCGLVVVDSASSMPAAARIAALAAVHGATTLRVEEPGLSRARNAGLAITRTEWVAYIDDDVRVSPDWVDAIAAAIRQLPAGAAALGGRIMPHWEAPCPSWWPPELIPALTVLTWNTAGRVGDGGLPPHVEPYGANMVFRASALRAIGGFPPQLGRVGSKLLSGEELWVVRALRSAGHDVYYDPKISVTHSIQANRLTPGWLVKRQFWSGVSEAMLIRGLQPPYIGLLKAMRMALHAATHAPLAIWPHHGVAMIRRRCAFAFAFGYLRGYLSGLWR
jgi:glycosyltransferase involved in cell wall biosynthesis